MQWIATYVVFSSFITAGLGCRAVPRDCPQQCKCHECWPVIECSGENITDFNFTQSLTWVYKFEAKYTNIPELQSGTIVLPYLPNMQVLDLSFNGITTLTEQLFVVDYTRLTSVILSHNKLTVIPTVLLKSAPAVSYIDLDHNLITTIPSYTLRFDNVFKIVLLSFNDIGTLGEHAFTGLTELVNLNLSHNNLVGPFLGHWDDFHDDIETIVLSGNGLRQIPSLTQNTSVTFACEELLLDSNKIETLTKSSLAGFGNLLIFNAENNSIATIEDQLFGPGNHGLETLHLSRNKLTDVPVALLSRLTKLSHLSLSFNQITTLPSKAFIKNTKLKWLLLDHNAITSVHAASLNGLNFIQEVDLRGNRLSVLPKNLLRGKFSFDIILTENTLYCNCEMKSLQDWFTETRTENDAQCQEPKAYQGQNITDVDFEHICLREKEAREKAEEEERAREKEMMQSQLWGLNISYLIIGGVVFTVLVLVAAVVIYRRKIRVQTTADMPLCEGELGDDKSLEKK